MIINKWDNRFLELAKHIAQWSKDPSTKIGAVIVRPDKTIASVGYNGFPRGIADDERLRERLVKYQLIIHAEMNAILNAKEPLNGYTLYTWPPALQSPTCDRCASHIIQTGIIRVVSYLAKNNDPLALRWKEQYKKARNLYEEAGVRVDML